MEIFIGAILTLVVSLVIAWATAHWTVKKSLKQFYSQKLWEKKSIHSIFNGNETF